MVSSLITGCCDHPNAGSGDSPQALPGGAFSHPNVSAETLPDGHCSIRILEKLGMRLVGATVEVFRWRLDRQYFKEEGGAR